MQIKVLLENKTPSDIHKKNNLWVYSFHLVSCRNNFEGSPWLLAESWYRVCGCNLLNVVRWFTSTSPQFRAPHLLDETITSVKILRRTVLERSTTVFLLPVFFFLLSYFLFFHLNSFSSSFQFISSFFLTSILPSTPFLYFTQTSRRQF